MERKKYSKNVPIKKVKKVLNIKNIGEISKNPIFVFMGHNLVLFTHF